MSTDTAQSLAEQIDALKAAARECGPLPDEPFIQMAFLSASDPRAKTNQSGAI